MVDVPRETSARDAALALAGQQGPILEQYAQILATDGIDHGMIGPREIPRLWERHLLNCLHVVPRIPHGARVADVGSGAGLPGLVWAIARPDLDVTLIEPLLRRTRFLEATIAALGVTNVRIVRERAENVDEQFRVVTARAVAALDKLARWCLPLVEPGGVLIALKGRSAAEELDTARPWLARQGARDTVVTSYGSGDMTTTTVEVTVSRETPHGTPRRR